MRVREPEKARGAAGFATRHTVPDRIPPDQEGVKTADECVRRYASRIIQPHPL